jgi:hypothetical protein
MNQDDYGVFQIAPNGTIFSFDGNNTVIDSKQLTGEEFKALTGCNMVTPSMPSSADLETTQCLQKYLGAPNSDVSPAAKRTSELFERACPPFWCKVSLECVYRGYGCSQCEYVFISPLAWGRCK